ncbi:MAG: ferritin-like domain-containing protein [Bacteriovorax sp.]|jgi:rubrerythrin
MKIKLNQLLIKKLTPLIWKIFPARKAQAISRFSMIEKDSAVQLLECMKFVGDNKIKADLFQHVLEEFHHADLFEELAKNYSDKHLNLSINSRENIINENSTHEDFLKFYAYVHVGESDVNEDFEVYANAIDDTSIRRTFLKVAADENRHEVGTDQILFELCNNDKIKTNRLILISRLKRSYKMYTIAMKNIGQIVFNFYMSIIYFCGGLFMVRSSRKQFLWTKSDHLDFLKNQIADLKREL